MEKPITDLNPSPSLDPQVGLLLSQLEKATEDWREELVNVTDDVVVWQPFRNGHSIGAIILHMADCEAWWIHEVGAGEVISEEQSKLLLSNEIDQFAVQWPAPPCKPISWYFEQHDRIRRHTREIIFAINDPMHLGARDDKKYTLRWLINRIIVHEAYHGGQAVLLSLIYDKTIRL